MTRDLERTERITDALRAAGMAAVVCALPSNVLLLTGYWPVVGTALALTAQDGQTIVVAPEDERELAENGAIDNVHTFQAHSLGNFRSVAEAVREPLKAAIKELGIGRGGRIAYEAGAWSQPSSYAAMHLYGASLREILDEIFASGTLVAGDEMLARLRAVKTTRELERIRASCRIAEQAFRSGASRLRAGLKETEAAAMFQAPLGVDGAGERGVERSGGFTFCMSGANSALAYKAYARSRAKVIAPDDLVLLHCNSYADGYWTDITRTFCPGAIDDRKWQMYEAVFAARQAALGSIRSGVRAADVDRAARATLAEHGFGEQFKHGTGHGVGFAAMSADARPRLHPQSRDVIETGMVFNVEPAIYIEGYGGLRYCDMIAVTQKGAELLTPFQSTIEDLVVATHTAQGG